MAVPTSDNDRKNAARSMVTQSFYKDSIVSAYADVADTSYSNKTTALSALDDLYDAWDVAVTAIETLA